MTRRVALVALALSALVLAVAAPAAAQADATTRPERRLLVLAVPGLRWIDVEEGPVEHLRALLDESAIANLATRVTGGITTPDDGYLTLGAGTRAIAPSGLGGSAYNATDPFGASTAADEHLRQRGRTPDGDVVSLSWPLITRANEATEFRAEIGTLGQALEDAGVRRGVVANADGADPLLLTDVPQRDAAVALADEAGVVSCGSVNDGLLRTDDLAPFGLRLDHAAVLAEVDRCSTPGSVVLVEASDLRRATEFAPRATSAQADAAWDDALASTDRLVVELLRRVDPSRDAVVVVAPTVGRERGLGVLGVRAPEVGPGLLASGNTRRAGYALLTDVAPTLAELAGVDLDDAGIEGRPVEVRSGPRSAVERRAELIDGEEAALFRDRIVDRAVLVLVSSVGVLAILLAVALTWRRGWLVPWLERVALMVLAFPTVTYLAGLFPFHDWGDGAYWAFVGAGSVLIGGGVSLLRGTWLRPLVAVAGLLVATVTVSVVALGSRLQVSTVFGDSPVIAGRFTGINNVTFSFFAVSGILLACVVVHRVAAPRGRWWMVLLLGAVLVVDVAPMWGADVGGALAGLPALALVAMGLGRWQVRWRTVGLLAVATIALVVVLGVLDLARDSADRSHLGRLFERIGSDGTSGLSTVVERKLSANLRSLRSSPWRFIFGPLLIAGGLVAWRARDRVRALVAAFPPVTAALPGLGVAALLGYGLNDSGIAVPAAMLAVLVPALVYLACRTSAESSPPVEEAA